MKRYLVYRMIITSDEIVGNQNNIQMETIIRNVGAKNEEEAIGKFEKLKLSIEPIKKLDIRVFELDDLSKID
jgi:hypothetical protein|tara:strand:- start:289 stop:504 length:216 start_codon:yes stop_codon:yes gene_type:complete